MSHDFRSIKIYPRTSISISTTVYIELNVEGAELSSVFLRWFDGTSSATVTLETTNLPPASQPEGVASDSTGATEWYSESTVTITGPAASAAGCEMVHLGNLGARRWRLKVVTTAATDLEVWGHAKG